MKRDASKKNKKENFKETQVKKRKLIFFYLFENDKKLKTLFQKKNDKKWPPREGVPPKTAQKNNFLKAIEVKNEKGENPQPWTLKVALRPLGVFVVPFLPFSLCAWLASA